MNFKENLKKLRKEQNLTRDELASSLNIAKGTLRNWEQGLYQPKFEILEELTKILKCDYNALLE